MTARESKSAAQFVPPSAKDVRQAAREQAKRNADLLAALEQIVLEHDASGADWATAGINRARAAIARAKGGAK